MACSPRTRTRTHPDTHPLAPSRSLSLALSLLGVTGLPPRSSTQRPAHAHTGPALHSRTQPHTPVLSYYLRFYGVCPRRLVERPRLSPSARSSVPPFVRLLCPRLVEVPRLSRHAHAPADMAQHTLARPRTDSYTTGAGTWTSRCAGGTSWGGSVFSSSICSPSRCPETLGAAPETLAG